MENRVKRWGLTLTGLGLPVIDGFLGHLTWGVVLLTVLIVMGNSFAALVVSDPARPLADFGWAKTRSNKVEFYLYLGLEMILMLGFIWFFPTMKNGLLSLLVAFQFLYSVMVLVEAGFIKVIKTRYPDGGKRVCK